MPTFQDRHTPASRLFLAAAAVALVGSFVVPVAQHGAAAEKTNGCPIYDCGNGMRQLCCTIVDGNTTSYYYYI